MTTGHTAPDRGKSTIARTMGKAKIFSESLPFIKEFRDTTVVIKYGGSAMVDEGLRSTFADDIAMLYYVGIDPVIVHGGGPHISKAMHQRGVEPQFVEGLRITDAETIRVVQSTLAGEINPDIVRLINAHGSVATGINGLDAADSAVPELKAIKDDEKSADVKNYTTSWAIVADKLQGSRYGPGIIATGPVQINQSGGQGVMLPFGPKKVPELEEPEAIEGEVA